jgi:hypothetical protein
VVRVDEARQAYLPAEIDDRVGRAGELGDGADLLDDAVFGVECSIPQIAPATVHAD